MLTILLKEQEKTFTENVTKIVNNISINILKTKLQRCIIYTYYVQFLQEAKNEKKNQNPLF